jgi:hypothetical protein
VEIRGDEKTSSSLKLGGGLRVSARLSSRSLLMEPVVASLGALRILIQVLDL